MTITLVNPAHPGDTPASARIRRVSASMARVCLAIACAIPLLPLLVFGLAMAGIVTRAEPVAQEPLAVWAMVVLGVSKVLPLVLLMVGLWRAHACFKRFAKGQFFASSAVRALREFSAWTAASALTSLPAMPCSAC